MRRTGNLYASVVAMANLEEAADSVCSARRDKVEVAQFNQNRESNLEEIQRMLLSGSYTVSPYHYFKRNEHGKIREIADLPLYPDRIIRQAIAQVIEPVLDRTLIDQTHAARRGRGIHSALAQAQRYVQLPRTRYCLSMDVRHCYASIDRTILKQMLWRKIKDRRVMSLLYRCIDGYPLEGIAIGDRLSPIFCNIYFSGVDHHAKEKMRCHMYIRYADNIFVFGNSKEWLKGVQNELGTKLHDLNVQVKENWSICDLEAEGVDFLGYRVYKGYVLLRRKNKVRMKRAVNRIEKKLDEGRMPDSHDRGTLASYRGMMVWCDSWRLYRKVMWPLERRIEALDREIVGAEAFRDFRGLSGDFYE